jgi:predicted transcriptional regulator of viral defense system
MTAYDRIYDAAAENYGLITSGAAESLGVSNMALVMLAKRGRLVRVGRGVYRLEQHPATEYDAYAALVAKAGKGAFLWGPSVLALDHLCPTDPRTLYVAVPGRVRRSLGPGVVVKTGVDDVKPVLTHGIAAQSIADAIRASKGIIMDERLRDAAERARDAGLMLKDDYRVLRKELKDAE